MHHDVEANKDKLQCCFCRNSLKNQEAIVKKYKGDFVSVWCADCSKLPKQYEPKYAVCLCTPGKPKELEIEMAKSEIEQQEQNKPYVEEIINKMNIGGDGKPHFDKDETKEFKASFKPRNKRKVSNL